jgi:hypothetical protein
VTRPRPTPGAARGEYHQRCLAYRIMSQRAFYALACIRSHGRLAAIGAADVRRSPRAWSGCGTWSVLLPSMPGHACVLGYVLLPGKERSCLDQASARKAAW